MISTEELLVKDFQGYKNFNEFFYRKLEPDARVPEEPENHARIVSPADCRSVVYPVTEATTYWIKVLLRVGLFDVRVMSSVSEG